MHIGGWMTCDITSISTVYRSYLDDGRVIMKGCVQWNLFYTVEKMSTSNRNENRDR